LSFGGGACDPGGIAELTPYRADEGRRKDAACTHNSLSSLDRRTFGVRYLMYYGHYRAATWESVRQLASLSTK